MRPKPNLEYCHSIRQLIPQEQKIVYYLRRGHNFKEIAYHMGIIEGTAKVYAGRIYIKLDITSWGSAKARLQLIQYIPLWFENEGSE